MNRVQLLRSQGYSEARIAKHLRKSRSWVRSQLAEAEESARWTLDRSKPLPDAILDRLQSGGRLREDDRETMEAVGLLIETADRTPRTASERRRFEFSLEKAAHHLAEGFTPANDPRRSAEPPRAQTAGGSAASVPGRLITLAADSAEPSHRRP